MAEDTKHFWTSLPGILTGVAAVLTSVTGLVVAFNGTSAKAPDNKVAEVASVSAAPAASTAVATAPVTNTPAASTVEGTAPAQENDLYTLAAVISDKDGFSNVRAARSAQSEVLAVVHDGEQFLTYKQDTKWWRVKTRDGVIGYMHESRIRLLERQ